MRRDVELKLRLAHPDDYYRPKDSEWMGKPRLQLGVIDGRSAPTVASSVCGGGLLPSLVRESDSHRQSSSLSDGLQRLQRNSTGGSTAARWRRVRDFRPLRLESGKGRTG